MNAPRRQRTAIAWLCAAAMLLLGFVAQQHALSHALTTLQSPLPNDPAKVHVQGCELCLQLAGTGTALPPGTPAIAHDAAEGFDGRRVARPCRAEAFVAYASRAPPQSG
jgi:hypothetical protein